MKALRVLRPGPLSNLQDQGRVGWQAFGVPLSGAQDKFSSRVANLLVGNSPDLAVIEMTFMGDKLEVLGPCLVALAGADMPLTINNNPAPAWTALAVKPGDKIAIGQATRGLRGYLAVSGGLDAPLVMGSRSTYLGGGFGGWQGRALKKGDELPMGQQAPGQPGSFLPEEYRPDFAGPFTLRAVAGPQDELFEEGLSVFFGNGYTVSDKVNRQGCRLFGPAVERKPGAELSIISESNVPGGVQVPADGQPIIVLTEQTTSGYTKVASVISPDLDLVAQARPGQKLSFSRVTLQEAHAAYLSNLELMDQIRREVLAG